MGGQGSGGSRVGAGRKGKTPFEHKLDGTGQDVPLPPIVPVSRPVDLTTAAQTVWDALYPLALAERTLTEATQTAFRHLCEDIALRRAMAAEIAETGLTIDTAFGLKAHPLLTQYRGVTQRVEGGLLRFRLSPIGKPFVEPTTPADPFADMDTDAGDDDDDDAAN